MDKNTSELDKLLPCPFCGGAARFEKSKGWIDLIAEHASECVLAGDSAEMSYLDGPGIAERMLSKWNGRRSLPVDASGDEPDWWHRLQAAAETLDDGGATANAIDVRFIADNLRAALAAKGRQEVAEPVATVEENDEDVSVINAVLPIGTKLYTAPVCAAPAAPALTAEHRAVIEEAAQVLESAAAHNRAKGRTVLEHTQQDRANRLRAILAAPTAAVEPSALQQDLDSIAEELEAEASNYEGDFADTVNGCAEALRQIANRVATQKEGTSEQDAKLVERIKLRHPLDGAELVRDGSFPNWILMRGPNVIRYLDKFERNFVNSAIDAAMSAAPAQDTTKEKA